MTLDDRIESLKVEIQKVDGELPLYRAGNRAYGAIFFGLGAGLLYLGAQADFPVNALSFIGGAASAVDGGGTLVTGKLHWLFYNIFRVHPSFELERVERVRMENEAGALGSCRN